MVEGNTTGIRNSLLERLEYIEEQHYEASLFLPPELARELCDLTQRIGREIAVNIARDGMVMSVSIGDASTVAFPQLRRPVGMGVDAAHAVEAVAPTLEAQLWKGHRGGVPDGYAHNHAVARDIHRDLAPDALG